MKRLLPSCLSLLFLNISFGQDYKIVQASDRKDIHLTDSVIYFDNKPMAYYYTELNETDPHYNICIKSLNMNMLVDAQVVKFDAPVAELKPFYYYNIIFKNENDTFSVYHHGQSFIVELATLLKDYRLLDGNKINRNSLTRFKRDHNGSALLVAKIREYVTYLNETRYFNEQTIRDRTKPVTIINDRTIMQDGKKIGLIVRGTEVTGGGVTFSHSQVVTPTNSIAVQTDVKSAETSSRDYIQVLLPTARVVDATKMNIGPKGEKTKLYKVSTLLNKEARNDELLSTICQLIENYLL